MASLAVADGIGPGMESRPSYPGPSHGCSIPSFRSVLQAVLSGAVESCEWSGSCEGHVSRAQRERCGAVRASRVARSLSLSFSSGCKEPTPAHGALNFGDLPSKALHPAQRTFVHGCL